MHITFYKPAFGPGKNTDAMEPLVFGILSALTPPEIERRLVDERLEDFPEDLETDLVAMTVETFTARQAYARADQLRARGIKVLLGGFHPTFLPEEAGEHADANVLGDAEGVWGEVLSDLERGSLRTRYGAAPPPALNGLRVDRSIFAGKRYTPLHLVQAGRGCRYHCDFCSIHAFYGASIRMRPLPGLLEELRNLPRKTFFFVDDNLLGQREECKALLEAMIPLNLRWFCQCSLDIARDPELLELLARAGCITVLVGFESLNESNLRQMRKAWSLAGVGHEEALRRFRAKGISVYGTFVFGYDGDAPDSFQRTLDFSIDHRLILANFNPLTPTPGTPLYDRLRTEGRLLHAAWWLDPDYRYGDATFRPVGMSPEQLRDGCYRIRTQFHSLTSITRRALDFRANARSPRRLSIHLAANLISRREIQRKQGMHLHRS